MNVQVVIIGAGAAGIAAAKRLQIFQRARLAEPINHKLYFAGEATTINHFCTCHGAMMTGDRAAKEVM